MPFRNRVRLPLFISQPQFPSESNVFRLADGTSKVQSVIIRKVYIGLTDYLPEWVHQRLKIALAHDTVNIESDKYLGGVASEGDYEIDWQDFRDYPYAQAKFKVQVTPFDATNSNCQSCEEATQLDLVDDHFTETLNQGTEYTMNVFTNDVIGCSPFVAEITWFNFVFVESASLSATGVLTIMTKPLYYQHNTAMLVKYKVTCPNGSYDEATVFSDVTGDIEACLEPLNVRVTSKDYDSAIIAWDAPSVYITNDYDWKIVEENNPAVILQQGQTDELNVSLPVLGADSLDPATDYIFSVRSKCSEDEFSDYINLSFTTDAYTNTCGRYTIQYFDEFTTQGYKDITYIACNGSLATIRLLPFTPRTICALQNTPGVPVSIIGADSIIYLRPCV